MDFPFSPSKWIPEDDLLLKNAVEAGASLESLAKGAVCFSCKFDIQELQDRWFSLLYDLDTSIEASSRIVEIEIEHDVPNPRNLNRSFKSIRKEFPLRKRKVDSIQDLYYRMRKRLCSEPFIQQTHHRAGQYDEQYPFPEFAEDGLQVHGSISNRPFYTETMDQDVTVYPPTYVESNNITLSSLAANYFNNSMDNLQHPHFQPNLSDWRVGDFTGQSGHMDYHLSKNGKMKPANDAVLCKISISETIKLNQFSVDCLYSNLNITKEENPFKIDIGESDFVLSFDLGDYLLNSPCDASQDGLPSMTSNPAEDILEIPAVTDVESSPELVCDSMNSSLENDHAAKASSDTSDLDESQALMICVLNIQDLEVPTNDDVTFPSEDLQAGFAENLEIYNSHLCENSSLEHVNGISKEFLKLTEEHIAVAKESLKEKSSDFMANVGLSEWGSVVRSGKNIENKLDRSISANFDSNSATDARVYKRTWTVGSDSPAQHNHVLATEKSGNAVIHFCDQNSETSISDAEDKISECDEAIPHFSDIEAMILDIDLNAIDHKDWALSKEVSRYWPLATKKVILKLEQAARSCIDREISSHGAFAVFYGRILKYFIQHAQILIGRATRDVKVDIDLGLEGFAKKISRRQAIIKMDEDGSFWLINIGCHSFSVNGKEVPSRKRTNLGSSSLIEITGMAFIFEVNRRAMEHYIASQCENVQTL